VGRGVVVHFAPGEGMKAARGFVGRPFTAHGAWVTCQSCRRLRDTRKV
jgi:hypothetical protein